jgi:hypothetical protein
VLRVCCFVKQQFGTLDCEGEWRVCRNVSVWRCGCFEGLCMCVGMWVCCALQHSLVLPSSSHTNNFCSPVCRLSTQRVKCCLEVCSCAGQHYIVGSYVVLAVRLWLKVICWPVECWKGRHSVRCWLDGQPLILGIMFCCEIPRVGSDPANCSLELCLVN